MYIFLFLACWNPAEDFFFRSNLIFMRQVSHTHSLLQEGPDLPKILEHSKNILRLGHYESNRN